MPTINAKIMKITTFLLVVVSCFLIGIYDFLPSPYTNTTFGISIGMVAAVSFLFFWFIGKLPNPLVPILHGFVLFWVMGSFDHSWSELHITTIATNVTLYIGFALGIAWLYWYNWNKETPDKTV